ncbi:hypothetical protein Tco_1025675, partial [Tanacetum coccineum]
SPPLDNEDLQQIDQDDLEELDIRWQVAIGTGYSLKDKNKAKPNKTESGIGKSAKNRGQRYKRFENRAKTDISGST